jgi:hypothetical protein
LLGRKFQIKTDQKSLKFLLEQRIITPEQQKLVAKLVGFDYEILYRPGRSNSATDAMSRMPHSPLLLSTIATSLFGISRPQFGIWEELKQLNLTDPYMVSQHQKLQTHPKDMTNYKLCDGLLFF